MSEDAEMKTEQVDENNNLKTEAAEPAENQNDSTNDPPEGVKAEAPAEESQQLGSPG